MKITVNTKLLYEANTAVSEATTENTDIFTNPDSVLYQAMKDTTIPYYPDTVDLIDKATTAAEQCEQLANFQLLADPIISEREDSAPWTVTTTDELLNGDLVRELYELDTTERPRRLAFLRDQARDLKCLTEFNKLVKAAENRTKTKLEDQKAALQLDSETDSGGTKRPWYRRPFILDVFRPWIKERFPNFRYNVILRTPNFEIFSNEKGLKYAAAETAATYIENLVFKDFYAAAATDPDGETMRANTKSDLSYAKIVRNLQAIQFENPVNPVLDEIKATVWDGKDHLQGVFDLLHLTNDIDKIFVKKWFMQCIAMLHNDNGDIAADFVLIFKSPQGTGKTRFFEHITPKGYFCEGAIIDPANKDTISKATTAWITELGEIGSTFKKDIDTLKSFLSSPSDKYRAPYGKADITYPRYTSFCGTVNDDVFLVDTTGNRRFVVVELTKKMNYNDIKKIDRQQLWAQIYHYCTSCGLPISKCFRLTDEEYKAQKEINMQYQKPVEAQREIEDIITRLNELKARGGPVVEEKITASSFKELHPSLSRYTVNSIGRALKALGYDFANTRIDGVFGKYYTLPVDKTQKHVE